MRPLRVLLIADTHLGFDQPLRPRVERRRRGPDFFANFERALEAARRGEADLVVHGGDLLFRSRVRRELVYRAFEPLLEIDGRGLDAPRLARRLRRSLADLDPDAVVRLTVHGRLAPQADETLRAASLRSLAPATMTVSLRRVRPGPPRA